MESNRQAIRIEAEFCDSGKETIVSDDEVVVTDEIVAALRVNPRLIAPMALALAHRKTEQRCTDTKHGAFGNALVKNILDFESELRGSIGTAKEGSDTL